MQHSGRLHLSTISLAELFAWANRTGSSERISAGIRELVTDVSLLAFDENCAELFGVLRPRMRSQGVIVPPMDLLIATTALAHDFTLVTHNLSDFAKIPELRVVDWIEA
jgi:tRNA(fMet)-specific endonuclease VapC